MKQRAIVLLSTIILAACAGLTESETPTEELLPRLEGPRPTPAIWSNMGLSDSNGNSDVVAILRSQAVESSQNRAGADPLRIHILNIAAGNCTFVECPNSDDVYIFDCGSKYGTTTSMTRAEVKKYFKELVRDDEPTVVLSHPDEDHINLIDDLLADRNAESFWLGGEYDDYGGRVGRIIDDALMEDKDSVRVFEPYASSGGNPVPGLQCGDAQTSIAIVNVGAATNEQSLVAMLEYDGFRIIFPGDAYGCTENAAMAATGDALRNVDVVLASHHGAYTHDSNNPLWIEHVNPSVVIFSSGQKHGHPNKGVVNRYRDNESLTPASPHSMWYATSKDSDYEDYTSELSEYVTELTGIIKITAYGDTYELECENGC